ncbi:MAG: hypothetical protein IPL23_05895 [Saprospiraceae bacterium]|nr:hypothetical protein [Saprospiraceae bacterium]
MESKFWNVLQERLDEVKQQSLPYKYQEPELAWRQLERTSRTKSILERNSNTGISKEDVNAGCQTLANCAKGFHPMSKIKRLGEIQKK